MSMVVDVAKRATLFAVVGATLALVAPLVAMAIGLDGVNSYAAASEVLKHTANPLWLGGFFGAFGAIDAVIAPVIDRIFGDKEPSKDTSITVAKCHEPAHALTITNLQMQPSVEVEANVMMDKQADFVAKLSAEKSAQQHLRP